MASENDITGHKNSLPLTINGKEYRWDKQYITGSEIKELGKIPADDELFLKIKEPWTDEKIEDKTEVDLARPGIEHFFSKEKPVIIIVNGREKPWEKKEISFVEVVMLAFGPNAQNQMTVFTVTYKNGPEKNPQGSMSKGDSRFVKNKMIFNVTATDKS